MNALIETLSIAAHASNWGAVFIDAVLKSAVVLLFVAGLSGLWRGASAATRHWLWFVAMVTLLVLPLVSLNPPAQRALWRVSTDLTAGNQVTLAFEFVPGNQRNPTQNEAAASRALPAREMPKTARGTTQRFTTQVPTQWIALAAAAWLLGSFTTLSSIALARLRLRRMQRQAAAPDARATSLLRQLCQMLGINREVLLLQSNQQLMPMTWGTLRPVVLLPAESAEWSPDRLRLVLLHELAHVKRFDCLAQLVAGLAVAIYWFNPLAWIAARRMCVERERACDDIVTNGGCRPSEYATHLIDVAGSFRRVPRAAAIAMARPSGLARRIRALLDHHRNHCGVTRATAIVTALTILAFALFIGACATSRKRPTTSWTLEQSEVSEQLRRFVAEKREQAIAGARAENRAMLPEYKDMFAAAAKGNWTAISNIFENLRMRAPQYEFKGRKDPRLHGTAWQTILEVWGAFANIANGEEKYMVGLARDAIESMPPGSIYFGGTDPGRFLITALSPSHVKADPIFTITQNALADGTYVEYARRMYGDRIYIPTSNEVSRCFDDYIKDAEQRAKENKLKAGEEFKMVNGKPQVSGQVAVMAINALLAKLIVDKNPNAQFYIEESFPLEWMYPHLSPNGPIMKLNREAIELSQEMIQRDYEYWTRFLKPMIGGWLSEETPLAQITAFAERTFSNPPKQDRFVHDDAANRWTSKLRSSIAGLYAWRADKAADDSEKQRLTRAADFAFRQAYAVCPYSPEAVFRYCNLLIQEKRLGDALLVGQTAVKLEPGNKQMRDLLEELKRL